MRALREGLASGLLALALGALAGLLDALFRHLHPAIASGGSALLGVVTLYALFFLPFGLLLGLRGLRAALAGLIPLLLLLLGGGYLNVLALPGLGDPRSIVVDLLLFLFAGALGVVLYRFLPRPPLRRTALGSVLLLVLSLSLAAIVAHGGEPADGIPRGERPEGPDLLVILLDALRADHCSAYGYERPTTPNLERLAAEGMLFEEAYAPSSWTKPSVATLFTGLWPASHGNHRISSRLPPAAETLPTLLRRAGYRTAVFAENSFVSRLFGFGRGVEHLVGHEPDVPAQTVLGHLLQQVAARVRPGERVLRLARKVNSLDPRYGGGVEEGREMPEALLEWVDATGEEPWFAYLHLMKPHAPYVCPPPYDGAFGEPSPEGGDSPVEPPHVEGIAPFHEPIELDEATRLRMMANYDERILYGDALVGRVIEGLRERGRLDRTAILVISDHGELFGENGLYDHGHSLRQGVVRIPFLLRFPERAEAGVRIDAPVRLVDVPPTVLDLAGLPPVPFFDGRSVLLTEAGEGALRPALLELDHGPDFWVHGLVQEGRKVVRTRSGQRRAERWFDLGVDPTEREDRFGDPALPGARLGTTMDEMLEAAAERRQAGGEVRIDPATEERLRALGYIR